MSGCYALYFAKKNGHGSHCSQRCEKDNISNFGLILNSYSKNIWDCYCITDTMLKNLDDTKRGIIVYKVNRFNRYRHFGWDSLEREDFDDNSIERCSERCDGIGSRFAIQDRTCICIPAFTLYSATRIDDEACHLSCPGNREQRCGGDHAYTVFDFADSMCYNYQDKGGSYRGIVNHTANYEMCVPWINTTSCGFDPEATSNRDAGLDGNYCRNPGEVKDRPWCYISNCQQDICDVCQRDQCVDIFSQCAEIQEADPGICETPFGFQNCHDTCGYCDNPFMHHTDPQDDSDDTSNKMGKCIQLDSGDYYCGECEEGWTRHKDNCYKFFSVTMTKSDAEEACRNESAIIPCIGDQQEYDFIRKYRDAKEFIWIGASDAEQEGHWVCRDGTEMPFANWAEKQPDNWNNEDCLVMLTYIFGSRWSDVGCEPRHKYAFVCKKESAFQQCKDSIGVCQDIIVSKPDVCSTYTNFSSQSCSKSCGVCGEPVNCSRSLTDFNLTVDSISLNAGENVQLECQDKYKLVAGELKHACLLSGELSGLLPTCVSLRDLLTANNNIEMKRRKHRSWPRWAVLGHNDNMQINSSGVLCAWRFYASDEGRVTLQIVRPIRESRWGSMRVKLLSATTVQAKSNREYYIELPTQEQIDIERGDIIALNFHTSGAVITFDLCDKKQTPEARDWKIGFFISPSRRGSHATFRQFSSCRIYSVQALLEPKP